MNEPLISVVIPCYNLGKYVEEAICSVIAQTYSNWEILVVNDGSTDSRTNSVLKSLNQRYENVQFMSQKNQGQSVARNNGINAAKGKFIVCLDADDKLGPNYLKKTLAEFYVGRAKKVAFVTTWVQEFGLRDGIWMTEDFNVKKMLITNVVHAASMFKKTTWAEVGGYKTDVIAGYEDWELWLSMIEAGYEWRTLRQPLFNYRIRKNSMLASALPQHKIKYERLYELHEPLFKKYAKDLAVESSVQLSELHNVIKEKNQAIAKLSHEQDIYRKAAEELEQIQLSRATRPFIKLRAILLRARLRLGG